jgi:hypothetical protein
VIVEAESIQELHQGLTELAIRLLTAPPEISASSSPSTNLASN